MAEKQLRTELIENGNKKLSEFLEHKISFSKRVTDYEKAIQQWNNVLSAFVSKLTYYLYSKVEDLHLSLTDMQGQFQDLVKMNKTLHEESPDHLSIASLTNIANRLSKMSLRPLDDLQSFPLTLNQEGDIERITLEEQIVTEKELNLFKMLILDQADKKAFLPPFESSALNPEDSFYTLEKKHLGVHVYDGRNGTILKTSSNPLVASESNKASCPECGQPVSVLLQLQMGRKKAESKLSTFEDDRNNNEINLSPLERDSKPSSVDCCASGSAKKIVSFQPKTIILEENFFEEGQTTPKVREGIIRLDDGSDDEDAPKPSRSSFSPGSPPLKEDNIIHSASKSFQRRLSRGEVSDDGKIEEKREDVLKASCLIGLNDVKLSETYDVKSHIMYPIMLAKHQNSLYISSPHLKKICVYDTSIRKVQGFLKLPNAKKFNGPRNVLLYSGNKIMVLDEEFIFLFHKGQFIKSLFGKYSSNYRGLSLDSAGNESQQSVVYTLEKISEDDFVYVVSLNIEEEKVLKKIKINGSKGSSIFCKFLCVSSDIAIVTDRGSGKIFKVDLAKGTSDEVIRPNFVKGLTSTTGVVFHPLFNIFIVATVNKTLEILDSQGSWIKSMPFTGEMVAGLLLDGDDLYSAETLNLINKYSLS